MELHKHIKRMLKEKGLKLVDLQKRIRTSFGEKAVTYRTLQRIIAGQTKGNDLSLYQICMGLGITLRDLKENGGGKNTRAVLIRKKNPHGLYLYNPDAYGEILTPTHSPFAALKLILKPKAKTKVENDSQGQTQYTKWINVQKGEIICLVENEKYLLKKGDSLTFDSSLSHSFENHSSKTASCIIIQNPRNI